MHGESGFCRGFCAGRSCRTSHAICTDLGKLDVSDNDDTDNVGVNKGIFC